MAEIKLEYVKRSRAAARFVPRGDTPAEAGEPDADEPARVAGVATEKGPRDGNAAPAETGTAENQEEPGSATPDGAPGKADTNGGEKPETAASAAGNAAPSGQRESPASRNGGLYRTVDGGPVEI